MDYCHRYLSSGGGQLTNEEKEEIRGALREVVEEEVSPVVKEAVEEGIPIAVAEVLTPLIRDTVRKTIRPVVWVTRAGYAVLAIACAIMFFRISSQADQNTRANNRQDCYLAGLIRGSLQDGGNRITPDQRFRAVVIVNSLEAGKGCGQSPLTIKPPLRRANP